MRTVSLDEIDRQYARHYPRYRAHWETAVRFPSIGVEPAHGADCRACAAWFAERLREAGFYAELAETGGPPVVVGERPGRSGAPVTLVYGHYDVQPVDPLEAWTHPPFEPVFKDGRLWGRGASDDKGQLVYLLAALETLHRLAVSDLGTVKVVLDGQEESGSAWLSRLLPGWRDRLKADLLVVADTGMDESGAPAMVMGLRGMVHATVIVEGPVRDLHSGSHGGLAPNPAAALARLLAGLHDANGRVAVAGFESGMEAPTAAEREALASQPFDPVAYERATGVPPVGGEAGVPALERVGFRPTLEINGLHGGYGGPGSKTIIPARAEAKLSARLVPGQDPACVLEALEAHCRRHAPAGLRLRVSEAVIGGPALRVNADSPWVARAAGVLREVCGREPVCQWEGASIPVLTLLTRVAGGPVPLLVGFGLQEDQVHAPNESFAESRFRLGYRYIARLFHLVAGDHAGGA